MAYLFQLNKHFILVNSTPKNGVFCQTFSSSYVPKPLQIHPQSTTDYSAYMDITGKLYIATMPDPSHLNYYIYENNHLSRNTLISNSNSNYELSHPIIYVHQNIPCIVYLSHQLHSTAYNFVQENLDEAEPSPLLSCQTEPLLIKSYLTGNNVYIFFVTYDDHYHLNALHIKDSQASFNTYLTTSQPITDYSVCIEADILHFTYVSELHGKYQLSYFNSYSTQATALSTTQTPSKPIVFYYYNLIWVNAIINHKLQMLISADNGHTFSMPVPCSLQNNIHRYYFLRHQSSTFFCQELYASIVSNVKLCILSMIDFVGLHPDRVVPPELELLLEGLLVSQVASSTIEPEELPQDSTSSTNSMTEAKTAFMNELSGWELPPRM